MMLFKIVYTFMANIANKNIYQFVLKMRSNGKFLDVCSGASPMVFKILRDDLCFDAIDIVKPSKYQFKKYLNKYYFSNKNNFLKDLKIQKYDYVTCNHGIEHVKSVPDFLKQISKFVKKNGILYLSFPSEKSLNFPSAQGTLNFYDDPEHLKIVQFDYVKNILINDYLVIYENKSYKPIVGWVLGMIFDPIRRITGKVLPMRLSWYFYGFESILILLKKK